MKFVKNITGKEYDEFVTNHNTKSHFLQSYAWGQFAKVSKNLTPHYVGLVDENKSLQAVALLLQKHLPLKYSYFYAPRGFVIDFTNYELLDFFTQEIIKYIKRRKGIFLKIDPDIIYQKKDYQNNILPLDYNPDEILNHLTTIGFKHLGFTKNFETMQPRYTFRIDLNHPFDELEKHYSKTTIKRIEKAKSLGVKVKLGTKDDLKEFYHLMSLTESRKDFVTHNLSYYENLFDIFNKKNKMHLFLGTITLEPMIEKLKKTKDQLENEFIPLIAKQNPSKADHTKQKELAMKIDKLGKDLTRYEQIKKEYGNHITLNGHVIIEYGDKAWVLYAGNHNILTDTYANYETYYQHMKYCYDHGIKIYDQFGTIGDLREDNPLYGLHEFKRKFGGDYCEFIGEFDYIIKKPTYFIFTKLVPIYRKTIKKLSLKKRKEETKNETNRIN